ncbi:NAD(P)/FAD-dependent oxidoreductase [Picrophilus oshimae]|uniref:Dehydrogenase n=1 Tax=Picrophilus torridus (strain ATCC 700027 / DSM 9790 / JCM 10055 / NBRC 100828 / KAW 2/3) TaxID=1122961 RepID=Q6KZS4_PICTO|nr:dehydrogenase [Picrophilus oshimae]AAT43778.1 putative dehydrogenase [Picrophilus oshimae DSM 9789]SMD31155.1 Dehydrogenase (flavoprotein) [Picrophilus oshimae DSM 9789]
MIKIFGLGVAGSYLLARLHGSGFSVTGFDVKRDNYYIPCGYATNINKIKNFMDKINIDIDEYLLSYSDIIEISGNNFKPIYLNSRGLVTIDKNRLEKDIIEGNKKNQKIYPEIIIDATGVSRYYLGRPKDDELYYTKEYLVKKSFKDGFYFYFLKNGSGYTWSFPLNGKYHIGIGSKNINDVRNFSIKSYEKVVSRMIRLKPAFPVSINNIIGTGEAIGSVSPITGEGIVPSLETAEILFKNISKYNDLDEIKRHYDIDIKRYMSRFYKLNKLVNNVQNDKILNIENILALRAASKSLNDFGIDFRLSMVIRHFI